MRIVEVVYACGHENVLSTHKTTLEITKERMLTRRGDCVVAVCATKGAEDLDVRFKEAAGREGAKITVTIEAGGVTEVVRARGDSRLSFTHPTDLVVRRSGYVCGRTVAVGADKAAWDLSRRLVEKMQNPHQKIKITLTVES